MHRPVYSIAEKTKEKDYAQLKTLSNMCIPYGGFIMLLSLIPNGFQGRVCFLFAGGIIAAIGFILRWNAAKVIRKSVPIAQEIKEPVQ
ncbi:MAG: hypothetical protein U5R06_03175 [candidate division KSB1 bacterium]|nr:hypothetical protein [candidate division KSB1 bacterium]